jgi:hypothetical protein
MGKRSVAAWPKPPRPSSTLRNAILDCPLYRRLGARAEISRVHVQSDDRRTIKTDPLPASLATVTSPPIIRASLREAEPGSAVAPCGQGISLGEQLRLLLGGHTNAGISNGKFAPFASVRHTSCTAWRRCSSLPRLRRTSPSTARRRRRLRRCWASGSRRGSRAPPDQRRRGAHPPSRSFFRPGPSAAQSCFPCMAPSKRLTHRWPLSCYALRSLAQWPCRCARRRGRRWTNVTGFY